MKINQINNNSFKARLYGNEYEGYVKDSNFNGADPDSFVLKRIQELSKKSGRLTVFDVAAGQGRNTLPIAQEGHDVFAFEINP